VNRKSDPEPVIEVSELTKRYGDPQSGLLAVDHISFQVQPGEVFGFLGPNGAGKTTTIRLLAGLSNPTTGRARVLGLDRSHQMPQIKRRIGVVPEASNLYDELSRWTTWSFPCSSMACRAAELLDRFRLAEKRDTSFAKLSRGMKRALTIALRGMWYTMLKDLRAYDLKPPNVSWGILLPLTYAVEALDVAMTGGSPVAAIVDLGVLAAFTALFFGLATWALARRLA